MDLPTNIHISSHACLRAKLSQLRSRNANARETKTLIHDISLIVGCEALAHLDVIGQGTDVSPIGYEYAVDKLSPSRISLMPILRSGLGMIDAFQTILPEPVPVHHLGLFRDKQTMAAVEYYNNLPYHHNSSNDDDGPSHLTILVDPIIATGATACAAIETLKDWGVQKVIMVCVLASQSGLRRAAEQWPEGVEIWAGAVDEEVDSNAMIKPGLGDVGDRLFLTMGR